MVGLVVFVLFALWATNFSVKGVFSGPIPDQVAPSFMAAIALSLRSFKGYTTITNYGSEIIEPKKNIGRSITISISICAALYIMMTWGLTNRLSVPEIIAARDYSIADAA